MGIQKAKCDNCNFEQHDIFVVGIWGTGFHFKYACLKCKKIVTHECKIGKCPKCGSKLIKTYEENFKDGYNTCPNCGKRKLRFSIEAYT